MRWLANFIVKERRIISKIFTLLVILNILLIPIVGINYDMTKYLPEGTDSKIALDIVEQEFTMQGMARLMIDGVSLPQGKDIKNRIEKVDGVDMVLWLDSKVDVYEPTNFMKHSDIKDYYRDGSILFDITFVEDDSSMRTHKAINEIKKIAGENSYLGGSAVENKCVKDTLIKEVAIALCIAVPVIALILILTTNSFIEPFLFLLVTLIGIIINMGSNIMLGEISFFTFSVAAILQLAISMDYSIFLLHKYMSEQAAGLPQEEAMSSAIQKSFVSILASGLTTIIGFVALALMKFEIGKDMGLVLAKGIVISLICVIFLMPSIILKSSDKIKKTAHKPFIPSLDSVGKFVYKGRFVLIAIVIILVIPCYFGQNLNEFLYGNQALSASEGTVVFNDEKAIDDKFGRSNMLLLVVPRENNIKEKQLADELEEIPAVRYAKTIATELPTGIPESFLPESATGKFHTEGYTRYIISLKTSSETELAFKTNNQIAEIAHRYYPDESYVAGVTPSTIDIRTVINNDYKHVNMISIIGIAIILFFTFKSFVAPIVLLSVIQAGIFINMSIPYLGGETMIFMGYLVVTCLQLGATIDYAILLTSNYLQNRETHDKRESAINAISQSAISILTSGSILTVAGFIVGKVATVAAISQIGILIGRGGLLSTILVMGVLPPLLVFTDNIIRKTTIKKGFKFKKKKVRNVENSTTIAK